MSDAPLNARYVHTNLVARNWRTLAAFYTTVLGCEPVPPERDYSGAAFDRLTGIPGARLRGMHLRMPGFPPNIAPTLEIFDYEPALAQSMPTVNRAGFGHIAFAVDDVAAARERVLAHGGSAVGEIVTLQTSAGAHVTLVYMRDPEGNIIELQKWD